MPHGTDAPLFVWREVTTVLDAATSHLSSRHTQSALLMHYFPHTGTSRDATSSGIGEQQYLKYSENQTACSRHHIERLPRP